MNVAYAVLIKIREGQGLQMVKAQLPQLPIGAHFDDDSQCAGNVVGHSRNQNGQQVKHHEDRNGIEYAQPYIMIQGISLKQGQDDVR